LAHPIVRRIGGCTVNRHSAAGLLLKMQGAAARYMPYLPALFQLRPTADQRGLSRHMPEMSERILARRHQQAIAFADAALRCKKIWHEFR